MRKLPESRVYRFGPFELNERAAELRKHGVKIRLQEQPLRLLLLLLERRGEVVLREEIQEKLWPNGTIVEYGHGINAAVQRLRDALGDAASDPQYVETVARRGYRLICDVEAADCGAPASPKPEEIGDVIGHYRVIERLGAGTMGVVYRAEDLKLGRIVALKLLADGLAANPEARKRFEREARAASALNHPNVCTIFEVIEHEGQPAISMELVEGETLARALERGPIRLDRALLLAIQLADALDAAHRKGIVHGDLKPSNLILTEAGLKVLDFGLAEIGDERAATGVAGTPRYMSPEQAAGERITAQSDIFSFGVVLSEMSGSSRVASIVERCLAHDPSARWRSAGELKTQLERLTKPRHFKLWAGAASVALITVAAAWKLYAPAPFLYRPTAPPSPTVLPQPVLDAPAFRRETGKKKTPALIKIEAPGGMNITRVTLSPDGRTVSFVAGGRIFLRPLDETQALPVLGTEQAGTPFWSPDGLNLAFVAGRKLKKVGVASSIPTTLGDVNTNIGGAWGDRDILIGAIGDGLYRIPASGGASERLTKVDSSRGEARHMAPQFLPGNRRFIYVAAASSGDGSMLYAGSLDSDERQAIMPVESNVVFVPSSRGSNRGFLLQLRGRILIGQAFDSRTLRTSGDAFPVVDAVPSTMAAGASLRLADFAAAGDAIAFRTQATPVTPLFHFQQAAVKNENSQVTVIRNWMTALSR